MLRPVVGQPDLARSSHPAARTGGNPSDANPLQILQNFRKREFCFFIPVKNAYRIPSTAGETGVARRQRSSQTRDRHHRTQNPESREAESKGQPMAPINPADVDSSIVTAIPAQPIAGHPQGYDESAYYPPAHLRVLQTATIDFMQDNEIDQPEAVEAPSAIPTMTFANQSFPPAEPPTIPPAATHRIEIQEPYQNFPQCFPPFRFFEKQSSLSMSSSGRTRRKAGRRPGRNRRPTRRNPRPRSNSRSARGRHCLPTRRRRRIWEAAMTSGRRKPNSGRKTRPPRTTVSSQLDPAVVEEVEEETEAAPAAIGTTRAATAAVDRIAAPEAPKVADEADTAVASGARAASTIETGTAKVAAALVTIATRIPAEAADTKMATGASGAKGRAEDRRGSRSKADRVSISSSSFS
ncbi:unnamed protein product [Nesidiocoris tenuis]|uniref:Uncharacterized protein n=1 Tax=Nesidiocoris tenuis TaxID=355587 RepID=A0A6H5HJX0_9HEMI|nr:unnamed protein product [Nesidiocoris tenuis]